MKKIILFATLQLTIMAAFCQQFNIGDKVEIYNSGGWYKGSIVEEGSGDMAGYFKVKYDGYTQEQWMKTSNIRTLRTSTVANSASGPRNGTYIILSYGSVTNPLRLGYFTLNGSTYVYYDMAKKVLGRGAYSYNAGNKSVTWTSGPFKDSKWGGGFEIDRGGKTHKIRLNSVTIGSNSTDSN